MDFIASLGRQPLFRILGAIIVLVLTEMRPISGAGAAIIWILWVWWSVGYRKSVQLSKGW